MVYHRDMTNTTAPAAFPATLHCPECDVERPVSEPRAFGVDVYRSTLRYCGHVVLHGICPAAGWLTR